MNVFFEQDHQQYFGTQYTLQAQIPLFHKAINNKKSRTGFFYPTVYAHDI